VKRYFSQDPVLRPAIVSSTSTRLNLRSALETVGVVRFAGRAWFNILKLPLFVESKVEATNRSRRDSAYRAGFRRFPRATGDGKAGDGDTGAQGAASRATAANRKPKHVVSHVPYSALLSLTFATRVAQQASVQISKCKFRASHPRRTRPQSVSHFGLPLLPVYARRAWGGAWLIPS